MGKKFEPGDRPLIFYIKRMKDGLPTRLVYEKTDNRGRKKTQFKPVEWVPLDSSKELEEWFSYIDWEKQTYKIVTRKLEDILDAFGLTMSEIIHDQKQMKLEGFA